MTLYLAIFMTAVVFFAIGYEEKRKADADGKDCVECVLADIKAELHATAEMHGDGDYYLREEWIDKIIDKHISGKDET